MESKNLLNPPFFVSTATAAKFVQPIQTFLAYLVPLDVDVVPIKFHQFLFGEYPAMIIFVFFLFFSILAVSMATAAILKKSTLDSTTSHGI
jgi:hypothetical protein